MYVCLDRFRADVHRSFKCAHGILGELCFVSPMGDGLGPLVTRHILPCIRKCGCLAISTISDDWLACLTYREVCPRTEQWLFSNGIQLPCEHGRRHIFKYRRLRIERAVTVSWNHGVWRATTRAPRAANRCERMKWERSLRDHAAWPRCGKSLHKDGSARPTQV